MTKNSKQSLRWVGIFRLVYISRFVFICVIAFVFSGCASLMNTPIQNVRIESEPNNLNYVITNQRGEEIRSGTTPDSVALRTSDGLFQKSRYYVTVENTANQTQTNKLDGKITGWYWVNLISSIPGMIGLFIIDPFTGAMFTLPDESRVEFSSPQF